MKALSTAGVVLLVLGVALLVFSFVTAYQAFSNYSPIMPKVTGDLAEAISSASFELINLAARLAFIGIMVWASSIILKYGVELLKKRGTGSSEGAAS